MNYIRKQTIKFTVNLKHGILRMNIRKKFSLFNFECNPPSDIYCNNGQKDLSFIFSKVNSTPEEFKHGAVNAFKFMFNPENRQSCFLERDITSPTLSVILNDQQKFYKDHNIDITNQLISINPQIVYISIDPGFVLSNRYLCGIFRKKDLYDGILGATGSWLHNIDTKIIAIVRFNCYEQTRYTTKPVRDTYKRKSHIYRFETDICAKNSWVITEINGVG